MTFFHVLDWIWYSDTPADMPATTFPATVRVIFTHEVFTMLENGSWQKTGRWSGVIPSGVKNARDSVLQNQVEGDGVSIAQLNNAIQAEANTRHEEITTAINEEATERQQEIEELNAEIQETNRVLSGKVTQTLANITLNTTINGETAIAKTELAGSIPLIAGGSWANDMKVPLELVAPAYDRTVSAIGKLSCAYMDKIFKNWIAAGVKNIAQLEAVEAAHKSKYQNTTQSTGVVTPARFNNFAGTSGVDYDAAAERLKINR